MIVLSAPRMLRSSGDTKYAKETTVDRALNRLSALRRIVMYSRFAAPFQRIPNATSATLSCLTIAMQADTVNYPDPCRNGSKSAKSVLAAALLASISISSPAAEFADNRLLPWYLDRSTDAEVDSPRWQFDLGVELGREPDYVGSNDYEIEAFPGAQLHYVPNAKWRFRLTPETLRAIRDFGDRTLVQLVIEYEEGRTARETNDLDVLADGRDTVEAELTLLRAVGEAGFVYATWQPEILDRDKGVVYFVGAGRQWRVAPRWLFTPVIDVSWGDQQHMQTEFGVSANSAALLGQPVYDVDGGLKSSTLSLNFQWQPTRRLSILGSAGVEYYFDRAADSPLIESLGSRTGTETEITLFYAF